MFIYLTDGIRAYGNMSNGKLDGYNIISSIPSLSLISNNNNNNTPLKIRTFYGMSRNDKIYGRSVMIDHDALMITQFNNNELE
jgi:hypothetical protein